MNKECIEAATSGRLIKVITYETERGKYLFSIRRYKGEVYFFKYLNRKLVECGNLNKMKGVPEP